ncbi:hypothetical protein M408DRAFT_284164 [Serendipita vermifera MAFF 305830]|uniref:Uncharacterized protein n=1 Tax=Serendipita vermifera MAFF 305830 TaxID=933852 RepID=A0A0C2WS42_SERVB|nr:hypothetical protein M408DRAFT_138574 [Serendipita vermifera MAFF 305830]KIM22447.1 hypothetical protein M408DRAFT_284164 [Serendipita vermifera MAFF 305830]
MKSTNEESNPGTAFKTLMEERDLLFEFIAMIQKRLKIEIKHLGELRALQATWNPKWSDSGVSTLTSPLLSHISNGELHQKHHFIK